MLYTWGKNSNGQLGVGHVQRVEKPQAVRVLEQRVAWVACGGAHTACLVRVAEGDVDDAASEPSMSNRSANSTNRTAASTSNRTGP